MRASTRLPCPRPDVALAPAAHPPVCLPPGNLAPACLSPRNLAQEMRSRRDRRPSPSALPSALSVPRLAHDDRQPPSRTLTDVVSVPGPPEIATKFCPLPLISCDVHQMQRGT
jgi:hypothetical protein